MKYNGGPAFPQTYESWRGADSVPEGMSLRDWFAGRALERFYCGSQAPEWIAKESYRIADAMLAERERDA